MSLLGASFSLVLGLLDQQPNLLCFSVSRMETKMAELMKATGLVR